MSERPVSKDNPWIILAVIVVALFVTIGWPLLVMFLRPDSLTFVLAMFHS